MESPQRHDRAEEAVDEATLRVMRRLAQLMLEARKGIGDFQALAKVAFVLAAVARAREAGERAPPTAARISTETGLSRREVGEIMKQSVPQAPPVRRGRARADRVLRGWWEDAAFHDEMGQPAALAKRGPHPSLVTLVERYAGHDRVEPILREMFQAEAVKEREDSLYVPIKRTCVNVQWDRESVRGLGIEIGRHFDGLFHNLTKPGEPPRFVRSIESPALHEGHVKVLLRDFAHSASVFLDGAVDTIHRPRYAARSKRKGKRLVIAIQIAEEPFSDEKKAAKVGRRRRKRTAARAGKRGTRPSGVGAS